MIIYRKTISQQGEHSLVLTLAQLGAITKPFYLCQIVEEGGFPPARGVANFFLEPGDASKPIEAAVALGRYFAWYASIHSDTEQEAKTVAEKTKEDTGIVKILGMCLELERKAVN